MRKTTYKKTNRGKTSKITTQNEMREQLRNVVNHSMKIAEIKQFHKKCQNIFENRLIKKEENFIIKDSNFIGRIYPKNNESHKWTFISKALGKIITIEDDSEIKLYDFNTQKNDIYIINQEDEKKIISAELYEHGSTADSKLLILLEDLTFYNIDLIILTTPPKKD
jgi:hypothetical protein